MQSDYFIHGKTLLRAGKILWQEAIGMNQVNQWCICWFYVMGHSAELEEWRVGVGEGGCFFDRTVRDVECRAQSSRGLREAPKDWRGVIGLGLN